MLVIFCLSEPILEQEEVADLLHRLGAQLLELGRHVARRRRRRRRVGLGERHLLVELEHKVEVGLVDLGLADVGDELGGDDQLLDEAVELLLRRLAVAQLHVHRERLVLQELDLRRDAREVALEGAQHRLERVEHAVAVADLRVQPGERLGLGDVVLDRRALQAAQPALHLGGVLAQVDLLRQHLLHRLVVKQIHLNFVLERGEELRLVEERGARGAARAARSDRAVRGRAKTAAAASKKPGRPASAQTRCGDPFSGARRRERASRLLAIREEPWARGAPSW